MKFLKAFAIALTITVITTSCGEITSGDADVISSNAADTAVNNSDWVNIYSELLKGQNELEIDFTDYNIEDENDVTKNRSYRGCGLYDLDGNGVPELFISIGLWEGNFYHLFTADNNGGKYIGESMGALIEKSTGILFNIAGESGYTPDIAYEYTDNSLVEIPGYVRPIPENYSEIMLGEKTLTLASEDIIQIEIYDSLDEAVSNIN